MATELSRPSGVSPATVIGAMIGVVVALLVLRWLVGFVFTLIRLGVVVAIIAVVVFVGLRLLSGGPDED